MQFFCHPVGWYQRDTVIKRGFRWNTRTKYQWKIEGAHGAVVPVEDLKKGPKYKMKKIEKWSGKSYPVVSWDVLCLKIFSLSVHT